MEVIKVCGDLKSLGDIGVVLVLGAGDCIGLSNALGLYKGLMGPYAGVKVCGLLLKVVHGHIEELQGCTAAKEYYLMGIRDMEKLLPEGAGLIHNCIPLLGAVGDGDEADSGAAEILQGLNCIVNGNLRKKAGACVENMNFFGHDYLGYILY